MDRVIGILVTAVAMWVAVQVVPGLDFSGDIWKLLLVAFIFGLINAFIRPILLIFTLPITIMTLGLFLLVINALLLVLTGVISTELDLGFTVADFWAALLGSIVISIVGLLLSLLIGSSRMAGRVL